MPNNNAQLDVRNFQTNAPNWSNVQATNGQWYSYSYTGGTDDHGGYETRTNSGTQTINVQVVADPRYDVTDVRFIDDDFHQLTWRGSSPKAFVITDANTHDTSSHYCVLITDTQAGAEIACDPMIKNDPSTPPMAQARHMSS
jgi:hypothetical protein